MERSVRVLIPACAIQVPTERGVLGDSTRALSLLEKVFLIPHNAKHLPAQPHGMSGTGNPEMERSNSILVVPWSPLPHPDSCCLESKGNG